jgi:CheY-like chemotaxis protein
LALIFKDVSERKRTEMLTQVALEREQIARAVAEEAAAQRDEFVNVVSHELRTPLSAIVIWARALQSGAVAADGVKGALEAIVSSANLQHALVDDLLDMSRLKAGKVQIAVKHEDLRAVVKEAAAILHPTALARGVELHVDGGATSVPCLIDSGRVHQVLSNVIGNAIKFTANGGHVAVTLRSSAEAALIEVNDDGIGIAASFLPYLFDRFRQGDMRQSRSFGGLGLGLSIARHLVELHGGAITAQSPGEGRGATFRIELPLGAAGVDLARSDDDSPASFRPRPILSGVRVLLVEDESHTRAVLTWLLETCGAEVVPATDGGTAREATAFGARFDVLVCDIGLHGDDGCTLLQALREFPDNPLPALALTAYVRRHDRERALAAGFDAFMSKPVAPDAFVDGVAALAQPARPALSRTS